MEMSSSSSSICSHLQCSRLPRQYGRVSLYEPFSRNTTWDGLTLLTVVTHRRYQEVRKTTREVLNSNNSTAVSRRQRTKRKLYLMTLCILVPYTAMQYVFFALNILQGQRWEPYSFHQTHYDFDQVSQLRYEDVPFFAMNMGWVGVITVCVIVMFFGLGKEAINTYRMFALKLCLGRCFPYLHEEYDPDRSNASSQPPSWGSRISNQSGKTHGSSSTRYASCSSVWW